MIRNFEDFCRELNSCGFSMGGGNAKGIFALVELQMGLFITMTGRKQKKNKYGIEYGWNSTVFTTVENFWAERDYEIQSLDAEESYEKIRWQIMLLNPMAEEKTIGKFIRG